MREIRARVSGWDSRSAQTSQDSSAGTFGSSAPDPEGAVSRSVSATRVLIVEDDLVARRVLTLLLKREGFSVSEAATVQQAMGLLLPPPDWILLDLMLPDGSGVRIVEHVKRKALPTRVCVISGCHEAVINEARRAGADSVFVKPLDMRQVIAAILS